MAVRAFKYGSMVLAVAGVVVLLLVARRSQAPVVEIGSLQGTMNWAYVSLEGVVSRQPSLDTESGTLTLWVEDGSGELLVMVYGPEAEQMVAQETLPVMGDGIALEGTLRIKEDLRYLVLNVPETVEVHPVEPVALPVAGVEAASLLQRITIRGVIRDGRTPYEGLRIVSVRDSSGEIEVALHCGEELETGPWPELQVGQAVQVTGAVDRYRGSPQLSVGRGSDVRLLEDAVAIAAERRIGQLAAMAGGELAVVEGTILQTRPFSAGVKLTLDDGSGRVTLLLWQEVYDLIDEREQLVPGATVRVLGEVAEYRGELEIVPVVAQDVAILAAAGVRRAEDSLEAEMLVSTPGPAAPEAVVGEPATRMPGEGDPGPEETPSAAETSVSTVTVTVTVVAEMGIVTTTAVAVEAAKPTVAEPGAAERRLGQLSAEDAGQSVLVEGVLRSMRTFSAGVRGLLDDGTGTVTLVLWQEVFEALPDRASLAPGAVLQVEGEVDVYEGELEVIPQTPSGVAVVGQVDLALEDRKIGEITAGDVGQAAQVAGFVDEVVYFSSGIQYVLDDGSGQITLLLWQDLLEEVDCRHDLAPGCRVRARGEIDEYQGKLEIVPGRGTDVQLLSRGERLPVEERAVHTISAADEGRTFIVAGRVTRMESDGWLRLWIEDGTGELLVFVPQRVVETMPPGAGPGIRIRVTGEVDIYNSQLELIPLAGADIEVP